MKQSRASVLGLVAALVLPSLACALEPPPGGSYVAVMVNSQGQLGVMTSSARYKEKILPMDKASDALLSLKPVTFRYKNELAGKARPSLLKRSEAAALSGAQAESGQEAASIFRLGYSRGGGATASAVFLPAGWADEFPVARG